MQTEDFANIRGVERILHDLSWRAEVPCGLAGISDVRWNTRDDRMESFVLSETLKVNLIATSVWVIQTHYERSISIYCSTKIILSTETIPTMS